MDHRSRNTLEFSMNNVLPCESMLIRDAKGKSLHVQTSAVFDDSMVSCSLNWQKLSLMIA